MCVCIVYTETTVYYLKINSFSCTLCMGCGWAVWGVYRSVLWMGGVGFVQECGCVQMRVWVYGVSIGKVWVGVGFVVDCGSVYVGGPAPNMAPSPQYTVPTTGGSSSSSRWWAFGVLMAHSRQSPSSMQLWPSSRSCKRQQGMGPGWPGSIAWSSPQLTCSSQNSAGGQA